MKIILLIVSLLLLSIILKAQNGSLTSYPTTTAYIDVPNLKWSSKDTIITGDKDITIKQLMKLVDKIGAQKELSDYMLGLIFSMNFETPLRKQKFIHAQKLWRENKGFDWEYFNTKPYFTYKKKKP